MLSLVSSVMVDGRSPKQINHFTNWALRNLQEGTLGGWFGVYALALRFSDWIDPAPHLSPGAIRPFWAWLLSPCRKAWGRRAVACSEVMDHFGTLLANLSRVVAGIPIVIGGTTDRKRKNRCNQNASQFCNTTEKARRPPNRKSIRKFQVKL